MAKKGKASSEPPPFPWELIGANCLRTVCQQLGWKRTVPKARMIEFLQMVQENGIGDALNHVLEEEKAESRDTETSKDPSPAADGVPSPHTPKRAKRRRKSEKEEPETSESPATFSRDPHNTRHKGAKRVRVTHDPVPSSSASRTSAPVRRKPSAAASTNDPSPPKRKRGRPRKHPVVEIVAPRAPSLVAPSKGLFAGVVITSRRTVNGAVNGGSSFAAALRRHDGVDDQDADGEEVDENDDPVDDPQVASSLASSNKENDPFVPPDPTIPPRQLHATIADAINAANAS